jgi:hypothetical protein
LWLAVVVVVVAILVLQLVVVVALVDTELRLAHREAVHPQSLLCY